MAEPDKDANSWLLRPTRRFHRRSVVVVGVLAISTIVVGLDIVSIVIAWIMFAVALWGFWQT
jgi:hypothetical protein